MPAARRLGTATAALTALRLPFLAACADRPDASASASPAVSGVASSASPGASPGVSPTPVEGSVAGLPGWLYYWAGPDRVLRLTRSAPVTVLQSGGQSANVSPDGRSVAYLDANGDMVVADRDGGNPRAP